MRRACLAGLLVMAMGRVVSAQVYPAGSEFKVNGHTADTQYEPRVAMDDHGNFVVVWASSGQDGDGDGVFWRTFTSDGVATGGAQVNTYTTGDQFRPSVASDASGNFVVVWQSDGQDGDGDGVFGQRYDASGTKVGSEFQVNTYTVGTQYFPAIASDASGNFVVVWEGQGSADADDVFARRYDSSGAPLGGQFRVNTYTTGAQFFPHVGLDGSGNFWVVWTSEGQDGSSNGVFARRYDASGVAQGAEFVVNSYTTSAQFGSDVVADASGNFVVTWDSAGDGDPVGSFARRFDGAGNPLSGDVLLNTYTTDLQFNPRIARLPSGFVVTWGSYGGQDGDDSGIFGRALDASGTPVGGEFRVNTYTTSRQSQMSVASSPHGDFVVAWTSYYQDGSSYGVYAQRYSDVIFKDGFESGDVSRWSTSVADGTDLDVTVAAALAGTAQGLRARVNDTNSLYVQDNTPSAEDRYRARFYLDPNSFDPGEASGNQRVRIFLAQDALSQRVVTLVLKRLAGQYSLEARTRRNDGSRADTGFFALTNAPHFVEFDWKRATGPGAADGSLVLSMDDTPVKVLIGLDNDQMQVESGRLGVLSVKTGATGTLHFDEFESRRFNPIGAF
jgi:hypothetical protein